MAYAIAFIHVEDGVYGISFPDFPGCVSTGTSLDEVARKGQIALAFHVEGMLEDGEAMPVLRDIAAIKADASLADEAADATFMVLPVDLPGASKRINITLDETLLAAIDKAAAAGGESRSGYLAKAARKRLNGVS